MLETYLLSRKPGEGRSSSSNGHGRSQGARAPMARMANLVVELEAGGSDAELKRMLIAEAKRQGKPYGLVIRDITGGNTNTVSATGTRPSRARRASCTAWTRRPARRSSCAAWRSSARRWRA